MARSKTSIVWSLISEDFAALVAKSSNSSEVLRYFGMENIGGNNNTLWRRIREENIDASHFRSVDQWRKGKTGKVQAKPLSEVMTENSTYDRRSLKKRLIRDGILKEECAICALQPKWNGKPLVLRLDHINGIRNDNRQENLRLVCPNCDSQLPTFCGRSVRRKTERICINCGAKRKMRNGKPRMCSRCAGDNLNRTNWPSDDELLDKCHESSNVAVAAVLKVTETAVRKRIKRILADRTMVVQGALTA